MTKKRKILIAAGVAVAVLIALFTTLYLMLWAPPSKDDFTSAQADAENIRKALVSPSLSQFARTAISERQAGKTYTELMSSLKDERQTIDENLAKREEGVAKLRDSKVRRDEEVDGAFATYEAKEAKFDAYVRGYVEAFPLFQSVGNTCIDAFEITRKTQDITQYASFHKTALEDCIPDLDKLAAVKGNKPLSDYGKEYRRILLARQKVFDEVASGKTASPELSAAVKKAGEDVANNDPSPALAKLIKDSSLNGELNALIELLTKKAKAA